jgi:hypothetical protein
MYIFMCLLISSSYILVLLLLLLILPSVVVVTDVFREQSVYLSPICNITLVQYFSLNVFTIGYNLLIIIMNHRYRCNFAFERCNCNAVTAVP